MKQTHKALPTIFSGFEHNRNLLSTSLIRPMSTFRPLWSSISISISLSTPISSSSSMASPPLWVL
jgi:hypothetical protein